jgi:hypothetical protein
MSATTLTFALLVTALAVSVVGSAKGQTDDPSAPHILSKNGRHALIVDGAPYLILGAQTGNSSAWPAVLPKVWPAMMYMHANTVEIPVYWEQFEPEPGKFDTSVIDTIIAQARENDLRLILLWFATWKNGSNHYMPQWMKLDPQTYPNMIGPDGQYVDSPSPLAEATLQADIRAFTALMSHLKEVDPQHTVIMVQVQNEPGTWQCVRDHSPIAQKAFESPVPSEALGAMNVAGARPGANWAEAFGRDADEYFHVWHVARYIGKVAAAGKAVYPLPLYVNGSVRDPITPGWPPKYEVGGPNDNVFALWKAAAPSIDLLAPDIYQRGTAKYLKVMDLYARPDNPLFIPETIGSAAYARYFFAALGRGAIGYAPFGMDYARPLVGPGGVTQSVEDVFGPTALNYQVVGPMAREMARLNFEGKVQTAIEMEKEPPPPTTAPASQPSPREPDEVLHFAHWDALVSFGSFRRFAPTTRPAAAAEPSGRILVAELGDDRFLVTGLMSRVSFRPTGAKADRPWQYLVVEEGQYESGEFKRTRILNGDQTDWGLMFALTPTVLRVSLYTR